MMREQSIRVAARCLFRHEGQILTISAQDPDKPEPHYGVPGGGVEFGETTEQASAARCARSSVPRSPI
jgi:ADP-ribose pyrophosphatase YjhB (NUDIX family)